MYIFLLPMGMYLALPTSLSVESYGTSRVDWVSGKWKARHTCKRVNHIITRLPMRAIFPSTILLLSKYWTVTFIAY